MTELRALIAGATPGPWADLTHGTASQEDAGQFAYRAVMARHDPDCPDCQWTDLSWVETTPDGLHIALTGNGPNASNNAAYIAACDPDTIAELLDAHDRMAGALAKAERLNAMLPDELTRLADLLEAKVPVPSNRTDYFEGWLDAVHAVREELLAVRAALAVPKEENPE